MLTLILTGLFSTLRTRRALALENLALRHQLTVLQRTARRPPLRTADRLLWVLLSRLWSGWAEAVSIVQPATVIRWQRSGFRLVWTWKSRHNGPGRPAVAPEVRALIRRMSKSPTSMRGVPIGGWANGRRADRLRRPSSTQQAGSLVGRCLGACTMCISMQPDGRMELLRPTGIML
jgi:hypothetical protein